VNENDLVPRYNMIRKVCWESNKNGEPLIIFADGLPSNDCPMRDAITIIRNNKLRTIIEMKERIVDFLVVNSSPWTSGEATPDPSALIILLENNLVVIDLKTDGYPQFQHHHAINIHESSVSVCDYVIDPNRSFFQNLITSKEKFTQTSQQQQPQLQPPQSQQPHQQQQQQQTVSSQQHQQHQALIPNATITTQSFSRLPYPINGGIRSSKANIFNYNELIVTGHEDGAVRLWDSSGLGLGLLHKLKTQKLFDKRKDDLIGDADSAFKLTAVAVHGSYLAVAAAGGYVTLYKYYPKTQNQADEEMADIPVSYLLLLVIIITIKINNSLPHLFFLAN
jgi:WD40 repeat protein